MHLESSERIYLLSNKKRRSIYIHTYTYIYTYIYIYIYMHICRYGMDLLFFLFIKKVIKKINRSRLLVITGYLLAQDWESSKTRAKIKGKKKYNQNEGGMEPEKYTKK
jgi:hypothetical protein